MLEVKSTIKVVRDGIVSYVPRNHFAQLKAARVGIYESNAKKEHKMPAEELNGVRDHNVSEESKHDNSMRDSSID